MTSGLNLPRAFPFALLVLVAACAIPPPPQSDGSTRVRPGSDFDLSLPPPGALALQHDVKSRMDRRPLEERPICATGSIRRRAAQSSGIIWILENDPELAKFRPHRGRVLVPGEGMHVSVDNPQGLPMELYLTDLENRWCAPAPAGGVGLVAWRDFIGCSPGNSGQFDPDTPIAWAFIGVKPNSDRRTKFDFCVRSWTIEVEIGGE